MTIHRVSNMLYRLAIALLLVVAGTAFVRVMLLDRFHVGGQSMEPTLHEGDPLWVEKWTLGARIYTKFDFSSPVLSCFRMPGFGQLKPGDIAVFNSPEGGDIGSIGFRINYVFAKRCIGSPGDTIRITNGFYCNSSMPGKLLCPPEGTPVRDPCLPGSSLPRPCLPDVPAASSGRHHSRKQHPLPLTTGGRSPREDGCRMR